METQPPPDMAALLQALSELKGEVARMGSDLADIKQFLLPPHNQLTGEQQAEYNAPDTHKTEPLNTEQDMPATQEIPLRQPNPSLLQRGKKPRKRYKHHCKVCDGEWIGGEPAPPSCNYCRSRTWQSGETKWALRRKTQETGSAVVD